VLSDEVDSELVDGDVEVMVVVAVVPDAEEVEEEELVDASSEVVVVVVTEPVLAMVVVVVVVVLDVDGWTKLDEDEGEDCAVLLLIEVIPEYEEVEEVCVWVAELVKVDVEGWTDPPELPVCGLV
jgi:hypothetical protein